MTNPQRRSRRQPKSAKQAKRAEVWQEPIEKFIMSDEVHYYERGVTIVKNLTWHPIYPVSIIDRFKSNYPELREVKQRRGK